MINLFEILKKIVNNFLEGANKQSGAIVFLKLMALFKQEELITRKDISNAIDYSLFFSMLVTFAVALSISADNSQKITSDKAFPWATASFGFLYIAGKKKDNQLKAKQ